MQSREAMKGSSPERKREREEKKRKASFRVAAVNKVR